MDIHMPQMNGLEATEKIMAFSHARYSSFRRRCMAKGSACAFDALDLGALEVIKKPEPRDWADSERIGGEVLRKVKILSRVRGHHAHRGRRERRDGT